MARLNSCRHEEEMESIMRCSARKYALGETEEKRAYLCAGCQRELYDVFPTKVGLKTVKKCEVVNAIRQKSEKRPISNNSKYLTR